MIRRAALAGLAALSAAAQAPLLQDGAVALRQERRAWTAGEPLLAPLPFPSLEVGLGGAGSDGLYAPLAGGEGLGHGTQGWGLGVQGRYVHGSWWFSATVLGLRHEGRTLGVLQRASLAYLGESGWRLALEQGPLAWGSGLNGGDLLGDAARPFPRLSLATREVALPVGRWRAQVVLGQLEERPAVPAWLADQAARRAADAQGSGLRRPRLAGGYLQARLGEAAELGLGAVTMTGGRDGAGRPAPGGAARTTTLLDLKLRLPALARLVQAQGASAHLGRSAAPQDRSVSLSPARTLGGLQLAWARWDFGLEYAGAATSRPTFSEPAHLAGSSTHGDPLGPAFGREVTTWTAELGLPFPLEGQGRLRAVRATPAPGSPDGTGGWFLQGEAQWRTATGRAGASMASRRDEAPAGRPRWGWVFTLFQAFRVF